MNIWQECSGINYKVKINCLCFRIVEDQARSSTRKLVSNHYEHDILEEILDQSKPTITTDIKKLHYLLLTPFRYPPLKYGSRFGRRHERGIFYVSIDLETAMSEKAFYRFSFLKASHADLGNKYINLTSFKIKVNINDGIDLTNKPFNNFREQISSPTSYEYSQILGSNMRGDNIEAFISYSARSKNNGKNMNIISPKVISRNKNLENTFKSWKCFVNKEIVEFYDQNNQSNNPFIFSIEDFLVDGKFPSLG